jgi:hypothetical protein
MLGEVPKLFLVSYSDASLDSSKFSLRSSRNQEERTRKNYFWRRYV